MSPQSGSGREPGAPLPAAQRKALWRIEDALAAEDPVLDRCLSRFQPPPKRSRPRWRPQWKRADR